MKKLFFFLLFLFLTLNINAQETKYESPVYCYNNYNNSNSIIFSGKLVKIIMITDDKDNKLINFYLLKNDKGGYFSFTEQQINNRKLLINEKIIVWISNGILIISEYQDKTKQKPSN